MDIKTGDIMVERGREHRRLEVLAFANMKTGTVFILTPIELMMGGKVSKDWFVICAVKLKSRKRANDITRIRVSRIPKYYRVL